MRSNKLRGDLSPEALEAIARNANFSSFGGDEGYDGDEFEGESAYDGDEFEGESAYDGFGDDMVDFGGKSGNFLQQQAQSGRIFTMYIENSGTAAVDKVIILNPAYTAQDRVAGAVVITDGVIQYGVNPGEGLITGSGDPKLIQNFLDFIKNNPTQVVGFKVKARTFSDQIEQAMLIRELSPFKTLESRTINLSSYQDEDTFQNKVVTVPERINVTNQTEVSMKLLAGEKIAITFYIGGIVNTSVSLAKKHSKALKSAAKRRVRRKPRA